MYSRGFDVYNYVGTYEIIHDEYYDADFIVSKESISASEDRNVLKKKKIFDYGDVKEEHSVYIDFANIDIDNNQSVINFCNEYGLPVSSQQCYDDEAGFDSQTFPVLRHIAAEHSNSFFRKKDTMDLLEFRRLFFLINSMVSVKQFLDSDIGTIDSQKAEKLLEHLIHLLFYSRSFIYDFDVTDPMPYTRCMRLQYGYQLYRRRYLMDWSDISEYDLLLGFIDLMTRIIIERKECVQFPVYAKKSDQKDLYYDVCPDLYSENGIAVVRFFRELLAESYNSGKRFDFSVTEDNLLQFSEPIGIRLDVKQLMQVAKIVFLDAINEGVVGIYPMLRLEQTNSNEVVLGDWRLRTQLDGMFMEFFVATAENSQIRLCANPSCRRFFPTAPFRKDKEYCDISCAAAARKRRQRERQKARAAGNTSEKNGVKE